MLTFFQYQDSDWAIQAREEAKAKERFKLATTSEKRQQGESGAICSNVTPVGSSELHCGVHGIDYCLNTAVASICLSSSTQHVCQER